MAQFQSHLPRGLVEEFVGTFGRIEWAMKESGKYLDRGHQGIAVACWSCLKQKLGVGIENSKVRDVVAARQYLLAEPPKVQVKDNNQAVWQDRPLRGNADGEKAIDAVQRVRNNLFHGCKSHPHSAPGRDEQLLQSSLIILDELLRLDRDLNRLFTEPTSA